MPSCLIALGANLGDRKQTLEEAVARLARCTGVRLVACSRWHETRPIGGPGGQGAFLNGAAVIEASLSPELLLAQMDSIEAALGRDRRERWAARTLDLDLLLYGERVLHRPDVTVPHPRMAFRRFVLEPAAEVAPGMIHPELGWSIARLYEHLQHAPAYVAIAGAPGAGKSKLAAEVAQRTEATLVRESPLTQSSQLFTATERESPYSIVAWLESQAALLQSITPPQNSWIVSDFWFDQAMACAADSLTAEESELVFCRMRKLQEGLLSPKLLVLLTPPALEDVEGSALRESGMGSMKSGWVRQCQLAIEQQVSDSPPCPMLRLSGADLQQSANDLAAAMEAMR